MVTTTSKPTNKYKKNEKESQHNTTENHQLQKKRKRGDKTKNKYIQNRRTIWATKKNEQNGNYYKPINS